MKSRAPIAGVNEPLSSVYSPILGCVSEECSRFYFTMLDLCVNAGLPFPGVTTYAL